MVQGLLVSQLEAIIEQDPRLSEVEKYWLQLSSYDLDKLIQLFRLRHFTNGLSAIEAAASVKTGKTDPARQTNRRIGVMMHP